MKKIGESTAERLRRVHAQAAPVLREVSSSPAWKAIGLLAMLAAMLVLAIWLTSAASELLNGYFGGAFEGLPEG